MDDGLDQAVEVAEAIVACEHERASVDPATRMAYEWARGRREARHEARRAVYTARGWWARADGMTRYYLALAAALVVVHLIKAVVAHRGRA